MPWKQRKGSESESKSSSFSTDSDAQAPDDEPPYRPVKPWRRHAREPSNDTPPTQPTASPPTQPTASPPSPKTERPSDGHALDDIDSLRNLVCKGGPNAPPLPRDGDRTRYVAGSRGSATYRDSSRMSLGAFLNDDRVQNSGSPSPVTSPAPEDTIPSSRSGSFSAIVNKVSSVLREGSRKSNEQEQSAQSTASVTRTISFGAKRNNRRPQLLIDTTGSSKEAMESRWSDDSSSDDEWTKVSAITREIRAISAPGQSVSSSTYLPTLHQSPSSYLPALHQLGKILHVNEDPLERSGELTNQNPQSNSTLPQASTSASNPQSNLKSFGSSKTIASQSLVKGESSLLGTKGKQKQSKKDAKKKDSKDKEIERKDLEELAQKRTAIDKMRTEFVAMKENELRAQTNSKIVWYSPNDRMPKHPNHKRTWHSKNLWCTWHTGPCSQCGEYCCSMLSAQKIVEENTANAGLVESAKALCAAIALYVGAFGREESTFLECTSCHRMACPKCCSICPIAACSDCLCKGPNCNPDRQWEKCDWHDD